MARGESQLSLFPQPKPTPEHRWPRGYDPERMHAVAEATGPPVVVSRKVTSMLVPPERFEHNKAAGRVTQAWHAQTDVLARSTVPLEDLAEMPVVRYKALPAGIAAHYLHPGQRQQSLATGPLYRPVVQRGLIEVDPRQRTTARTEANFLHEVGHHADFMGAEPRKYDLQSKYQPNLVEGRAEGYLAKHWRADPRGEPTSYSDVGGYPNLGNSGDFRTGFKAVSGRTPQQALGTEGPPVNQTQFQQRLFDTGYIGYKHPWQDPDYRSGER